MAAILVAARDCKHVLPPLSSEPIVVKRGIVCLLKREAQNVGDTFISMVGVTYRKVIGPYGPGD